MDGTGIGRARGGRGYDHLAPMLRPARGQNGRRLMPIYNFKCPHCGGKFKVLQKLLDPPPECCGEKTQKVLAPANFVLKGKGWFRDGY